ncbi:MAG: hypothetical protein ACRETB_09920, partial [Steroidobacteraceae bacterium]
MRSERLARAGLRAGPWLVRAPDPSARADFGVEWVVCASPFPPVRTAFATRLAAALRGGTVSAGAERPAPARAARERAAPESAALEAVARGRAPVERVAAAAPAERFRPAAPA